MKNPKNGKIKISLFAARLFGTSEHGCRLRTTSVEVDAWGVAPRLDETSTEAAQCALPFVFVVLVCSRLPLCLFLSQKKKGTTFFFCAQNFGSERSLELLDGQ